MLPERYDPLLVILSYLIAVLGSYTGLSMGARLTSPSGRLRGSWLLGGAFAQATGIWSMHFTGMLALTLPVPIAYNVAFVSLSFVIALGGSLLALALTQRPALSRRRLIAGGLFLAAAICGLHYTDMAAMRMAARTHYNAGLVIVSIVIAVGFGLVSLLVGRAYQHDDGGRSRWGKWMSAAIMGVAITGHHYTAMAGAQFSAAPDIRINVAGALPSGGLPAAIVVSTLVILGGALVCAGADRRRVARDVLSGRLLAAQEAQRRGIARVLHQDVGQLLTALRLNLQRMTPVTNDMAVVGDSVTLVDEALARVRAISIELRPSVLDDLGLVAAIRWYANREAERAGYALVIDEALGAQDFPETIETAAFRIVQQALTNIARHAHPTNVHLALRIQRRTLEVVVSDDGVGFDVGQAQLRADAGESLGLLDMRELSALAGGTLTVTSVPGKGSTVHVRFPLPLR
jgi:NO-binding membrane sensor protein with MHYT domain